MTAGFVSGVAVLGPGLPGWAASRAVLAAADGTTAVPWTPDPVTLPPPALLPATERRRASPAIRLALAVAAEAAAASGLAPDSLEAVFASSNGDGQVLGAILESLALPDGAVSPTLFHNSVHNAPAGYWSIAVGATRPSVSVGGHDHIVAAGLLHALARLAVNGGEPVLFCAYDVPYPEPLAAVRPTGFPFAAGLVLTADAGAATLARIGARYVAEPVPASAIQDAADALDSLVAGNAAARAMPLLRALAAGRPASLMLPMLDDARLELTVEPC